MNKEYITIPIVNHKNFCALPSVGSLKLEKEYAKKILDVLNCDKEEYSFGACFATTEKELLGVSFVPIPYKEILK